MIWYGVVNMSTNFATFLIHESEGFFNNAPALLTKRARGALSLSRSLWIGSSSAGLRLSFPFGAKAIARQLTPAELTKAGGAVLLLLLLEDTIAMSEGLELITFFQWDRFVTALNRRKT
jgi:hypothetical protein